MLHEHLVPLKESWSPLSPFESEGRSNGEGFMRLAVSSWMLSREMFQVKVGFRRRKLMSVRDAVKCV